MVQLNFDANQVAPSTGFDPVPEGWYNVAITESEIKPTKTGDGAYLQLKVSIIDGPQAGKPVFIRLNLKNSNQQAVDIAHGELSAICHATGVFQVSDSSQLHNLPFQIKVIVKKDPQHGESNEVKSYRDASGNEPGRPAQGGQPSSFTPAPTATAAPQQAAAAPAFGTTVPTPAPTPAPAPTAAPGGAVASHPNTGWTQPAPQAGQPPQQVEPAPWGNAPK